MKSNVCKIESGSKDLAAILRESEKVAVYNELTHKQSLQLRLLCEEIDGMLPNIIGDFTGELWIEFEDGECKVNVSLCFEEFTAEKKGELVGLSKSKKNAAAVGIVGKIRSVIEDAFLDDTTAFGFKIDPSSYSCETSAQYHIGYSYVWNLGSYKDTVKKDAKGEAWDELEKSVIASVADDIIVGVKGKRADIIIVKNFS